MCSRFDAKRTAPHGGYGEIVVTTCSHREEVKTIGVHRFLVSRIACVCVCQSECRGPRKYVIAATNSLLVAACRAMASGPTAVHRRLADNQQRTPAVIALPHTHTLCHFFSHCSSYQQLAGHCTSVTDCRSQSTRASVASAYRDAHINCLRRARALWKEHCVQLSAPKSSLA